MEIKRENTAVINATSKTASAHNQTAVLKHRFAAERNYRISRFLFESMLRSGLISSEDFIAIDTNLKEKINPISGDLFH